MIVDKKHLSIVTGEYAWFEESEPPKLYVDWFSVSKDNKYSKHNSFYFSIGLFGFKTLIEIKWGYK